jgi:hypothetical protein
MLDTKSMEQHHINQWVTWLANDTIPPPWKKKVQARCINMPKLTSRKGINFIATYLPQQSHMNSPYRVILATWKYSHYEILFCFQCIPSTHTHTHTHPPTHTNGSIKKNPWETGLHKQPVYPIFTIMWFDGINFLFFLADV